MTKRQKKSSRKWAEGRAGHRIYRNGVGKGHALVSAAPHPMGLAAIAAIVGGAMRNKTGGRGQ